MFFAVDSGLSVVNLRFAVGTPFRGTETIRGMWLHVCKFPIIMNSAKMLCRMITKPSRIDILIDFNLNMSDIFHNLLIR